ncbi:efflux RND transporter periplasmic adaptor subunit [Sporolactobacillus inulinus]|uniref:Possible membrane fusion protein n=2 Tax=Sporolactobacillus inulinus TaxID=2078 RepID=A0A4Y1ZD57_9BACL|nr:efflux RND transporter periplasmic adaptor subunit [Sporolactobacillus inulinus]KLI03162.1 hypothetical protein SINU_04160 [Sporolactobacillus inulinus CASD]GAY77027.1 possible membrane fusion protein [Sporolactobacillus inulinus]GEB76645.1 hemolysin D [Sporolactobacillus inulinus]
MKKIWITVLVVVLALGGGGTYWYLSKNKNQETQTLIPTTKVQKGTLETSVDGSGALAPAVDEDVTIDAEDASKTVDEVNVSKNDTVEKGDKLLTFTDGTTLTAPKSGSVTSVSVYQGSRVNTAEKVAHLTNYSDLNTVLSIDELDISKIKKGQKVTVTVNAFPNKTFSGKVTSIAKEGSITNGTSSFDVTVHLTKSTQLKPGMTTTAKIILEKKSNVLYLPSGAVHQNGNNYYVYQSTGSSDSNNEAFRRSASMESERGSQQTVSIGIHNDQSIEIKSGLTEGQTVQLNPITKSSPSSTSTNSNRGQGQFQMMQNGGAMNGQGQGQGRRNFGSGGNGGGQRP